MLFGTAALQRHYRAANRTATEIVADGASFAAAVWVVIVSAVNKAWIDVTSHIIDVSIIGHVEGCWLTIMAGLN